MSDRPTPVDWNQMIEMTAYRLENRPVALALAVISEQLDYLVRLIEVRIGGDR